jgi:hypothetical protein
LGGQRAGRAKFGPYTGDTVAARVQLNARTILRRARAGQRPGETPGRPFLTYDRNPDRLAWGVIFTDASGAERLVFVAGDTVYSPPAGGGVGG